MASKWGVSTIKETIVEILDLIDWTTSNSRKLMRKQMTNYNERLDEILSYEYEVEGCQASHAGSKCLHCNEDPCPHCKRWGGMQRTEVRSMVDKKTKQALTSLIKELVAEAKPGTWVDPDDTDELMRWQGYVDGIIDFEQNLLKQLEDK